MVHMTQVPPMFLTAQAPAGTPRSNSFPHSLFTVSMSALGEGYYFLLEGNVQIIVEFLIFSLESW